MVIFAVDVGGDRSAERDEAGAWRDRRKKTARQKDVDQLGDSDAGLASQEPGGGVEGEHAVKPRQIDDAILIVERRVAVGPARAARNQRSGVGGDDGLQLGNFIGPINVALGKRIAAPSGEGSVERIRNRGGCAPSGRGNRGLARGHSRKNCGYALKLTGRLRMRNGREPSFAASQKLTGIARDRTRDSSLRSE